ncbi:MAG: STAS domain-containing protein [Planctomycetota bacterium]
MAVLNFDIKSVNLPSGDEAKAVFLSGSIDASTNQTFEGRLTEILSSGTNKVLLVLTNVKYINSTGLGTIVKCVDTFREQNGDIKLVGVPTKVIALFEMLGLLALFETYDTIEDAVGSFGETGGGPGSSAEEQVQFPLQFKHPISGMGLNVSQPGRFKDPRSGDYFSVDNSGTIEFYQTSKVSIIDLKIPCESSYSAGIIALATAMARNLGLGNAVNQAIQSAIDEACSLIAKCDTGAGDSCHVLIVGDADKVQIGFVTNSNALDAADNDPCLLAIQKHMDSVTHKPLPSRGHLLAMVKKAA